MPLRITKKDRNLLANSERKEKSNVRYKLREGQKLKNLAKIDKAIYSLQSKSNIYYI